MSKQELWGACVFALACWTSSVARADGCDSDAECKTGRACVAHQCQRFDACERDIDCSGDLVCEASRCVAAAPADAAANQSSQVAADDYPRRTVDQPLHLPSGMVYADDWLETIADSSGSSEITFGQWIYNRTRAGVSLGEWELWPEVDLTLSFPRDAPTLWGASFEIDRAVGADLKLGAAASVGFPTADYTSYGGFVGGVWQRHLNRDNLLRLRGLIYYTDNASGTPDETQVVAGAEWDHQFDEGLALSWYVEPYLSLRGGDASIVPTSTVDLGYWTQDLWFLAGRFYASPDQGYFAVAVGRVFK